MVNREAPVHIQRFKSGNGLGYFQPMGVVHANATSTGNADGTAEDVGSYVILANSMPAGSGKTVRLTAWGKTAADGDSKAISLKFGATVVATLAAAATNDKDWLLEATIIQGGAGAQTAIGQLSLEGASQDLQTVSAPAETETSNTTVALNVDATNANDVLMKGFIVEFMN